ncbi:MAG: enoyl-CoA hydratase-related protein [Pseudomonadota bacterium]
MISQQMIGAVSVIRFDRPEALNALSSQALDGFEAALGTVAASNARAVIVTGSGERAFSTGADIRELGPRDANEVRHASKRGQAIAASIADLPMPSFAHLNGYALGGALELALACTFRLATPNARLGFPEVKLGVSTGWGGTQRLPRLIQLQFALDLLMSGRTIDADEARRIGLVHSIVDTLDDTIGFSRQFTENSLVAMRYVRSAVMGASERTLSDGLNLETETSVDSYATFDAREGIAAFLQKRDPNFEDR